MNRFHRWVIGCLAGLAFLAPLKFGTPVMIQTVAIPPIDFFEWLFFAWPNQLLVIGIFGAFVWLVLDPSRMMARVDGLFLLPLFFLGTQLLAAANTINRQTSSDTVMLFAGCVLLFYVAAWYVRDGGDAVRIFGGLGLATFLVCIFALDQRFGGLERSREMAALYGAAASMPADYLLRMQSNRVFATLVYPNALAGFLVLAFAPMLAWISTRARNWDPRVKWPVLGMVAALIIFGLVLTGSRGGFVAFAAAVVAGVSCCWVKRLGRGMAVAGVGLALLAGVFLVANRTGLIGLGTSSLEARFDYWRGAVAIARDNFWSGTGPGTFGSIYPKYKTADSEEAQTVHNSYLQMWSDSGVFAFAAFAAMWVVGLRDAFRLARHRLGDAAALALVASLTGFAVHGLLDFDLYNPGVAMPAFIFLGTLQGLKELREADSVPPRRKTKWPVALVCGCIVLVVVTVEGRGLLASFAHARGHELAEQNPRAALGAVEDAIKFAPYNSHYLSTAGDMALALHLPEQAFRFYERAIENDPYRASYRWRLARVRMAARGLDKQTMMLLREAVALNPTNRRYRSELDEAEESVRQSPGGLLDSGPAKEE